MCICACDGVSAYRGLRILLEEAAHEVLMCLLAYVHACMRVCVCVRMCGQFLFVFSFVVDRCCVECVKCSGFNAFGE